MKNKIKSVLIDLSGTIHIDNTIIPGAVEALKRFFFIHNLQFWLLFFSFFIFSYCIT